MTEKRTPIRAVLEDIRSVYNIGAIFRTSDAILAEKIHLCGITAHPPRRDLEKTALGATETVPWTYVPSAKETLLKLKKKGYKICALELTGKSVDFRSADYGFPLALVVGNEVSGVSPEVLEVADLIVSIPMLGRAKSLNVATAYGIVAYEAFYLTPMSTDKQEKGVNPYKLDFAVRLPADEAKSLAGKAGEFEKVLKRTIATLRKNPLLGAKMKGGIIHAVLTDDEEIARLNSAYRGISKPTDVIALSYFDELNFPGENDLAGEIMISVDTAKRQAKEHGHTFKHELRFLFVHGLLHLFGFDHKTARERKAMFALQDVILG